MEENFGITAQRIVAKALSKASTYGLLYEPQYELNMGRIEYKIQGEDSVLPAAGSYIELISLNISQEIFDGFIKSCKKHNTQPTVHRLIKSAMLHYLIGLIVMLKRKDFAILFNFKGKLNPKHNTPEGLVFASETLVMRVVTNYEKRRGAFGYEHTVKAENMQPALADILNTNSVGIQINNPITNDCICFTMDEIHDYCVNYM